MKQTILLSFLFISLSGFAQHSFSVYQPKSELKLFYYTGERIKYKTWSNKRYCKGKITEIRDKGFMINDTGYVAFSSLRAMRRNTRYKGLVYGSIWLVTNTALTGLMLSNGNLGIGIAALGAFNGLTFPYLLAYYYPGVTYKYSIYPNTEFDVDK